jgi:hypothetical protein
MLAYALGHMQVVDWLMENRYNEVIANEHLTDDDKQKLEQRRQKILQDLEVRTRKLKEISFKNGNMGGKSSFFQPRNDQQSNKPEMLESYKEQGNGYKRQKN